MILLQSQKMLFRLTGLLSAILIISCCAGCGEIFEQPGVKINTIHIKKINNLEAFFRVDIEVTNPNFISFEIKGIECDVEMDGRQVAAFISEEKTLIPAQGTYVVPLEVHSTSFDIISVLLKILKSRQNDDKKLEYKITGKIYLSSLLYSPPPITFTSSGNLLEKIGRSK